MQRPAPVSGIYAILGPHGVYVGEAADCWNRQTLYLAVLLGWDCGIVRELPESGPLERIRAEGIVARLFVARGLCVVSQYAQPNEAKGLKMTHVNDKNCRP